MRVGTWKKDMTIIQSAIQALDVPAPLFQAGLPIYAAAMSLGMEEDDTAAVFEVLEKMSGSKPLGQSPGKPGLKKGRR